MSCGTSMRPLTDADAIADGQPSALLHVDPAKESRTADEAPEEGEERADRNLNRPHACLRLDHGGALEEIAHVFDLDRRGERPALLNRRRDRSLVDGGVEIAKLGQLSDEEGGKPA